MIRHILEAEHLFHKIVNERGNIGDYVSPWSERIFAKNFISRISSYRANLVIYENFWTRTSVNLGLKHEIKKIEIHLNNNTLTPIKSY
ncbi:hypothetical protein [Flavobacterium sp. XS2P39]|uniref:hypothetical protein n=1 Tax=Flavobacterium sp. XS2P39 TaxID=3401725 RepID=UPI003AACE7B5